MAPHRAFAFFPELRPVDVLLPAVLASLAAALAFVYVSSERFIYFWDYAAYHDLTTATVEAFRVNAAGAWRTVHESLAQPYNRIFTLPLVLVAQAVTLTRPVFVTSLVILYQVPLALAVGAVVRETFTASSGAAARLGALLCLVLPATWIATLRGYPDAGAAALVVAAVWLQARSVRAGPTVGRAVLIGAALGLAMLFRRHFAYGAVAFGVAALIHGLASAVSDPGPRGRGQALWSVVWPLGVVGLAALGTVVLPGTSFLRLTLGENYTELYRSYLVSPGAQFRLLTLLFGPAVCVIATLGWIGGWRRRLLTDGGRFVLTFGLVSLAIWVLVVRQEGWHRGYHVLALVVPGLAAAAASVPLRVASRGAQRALWITGAALLALNLVHALAPWPMEWADILRPGLARRAPPLVRPDVDEVRRLASDLRTLALPGDRIVVGGSSETVNFDILAHAEREVRGDGAPLTFTVSPQVDSIDWYPLEALLQARFVLITTPFQRHLPAAEQDVVRLIDTVFLEGWPMSRDFAPLPARYQLRNDARLRIYRRMRDTPVGDAVRDLDAMRRLVLPQSVGPPRPWVALEPSTQWTTPAHDAAHLVVSSADARHLLSTAEPAPGQWTIDLTLRTPSGSPQRARLTVHAADGSSPLTVASAVATRSVDVSDRPVDVRVSGQATAWRERAPWLVLAVEGSSTAPHTLELSRLRATTRP
jgi:hypothetical protein